MSAQTAFSQLNNSSSKAMYSFSRTSRPSLANKTYCDSFYNIPETKTNRKASIGYGKKIDWDDLNKSKKHIPPPDAYNTTDLFTLNKKQRKGYTAGIGREETKNQSFIQFDKSVPGPQKYGNMQHQTEGPRYSLRRRTTSEGIFLSLKEVFVTKNSMQIPGPGIYHLCDGMNPQGKYLISKWQSSGSKKFDPKSSARFMNTKSEVPGPGKYTPRNSTWQDNGCMTESRYVSSGNRVFGTRNRSTIFEEQPKRYQNIPGPGMYDPFSQFGNSNNTSAIKARPMSSRIRKN